MSFTHRRERDRGNQMTSNQRTTEPTIMRNDGGDSERRLQYVRRPQPQNQRDRRRRNGQRQRNERTRRFDQRRPIVEEHVAEERSSSSSAQQRRRAETGQRSERDRPYVRNRDDQLSHRSTSQRPDRHGQQRPHSNDGNADSPRTSGRPGRNCQREQQQRSHNNNGSRQLGRNGEQGRRSGGEVGYSTRGRWTPRRSRGDGDHLRHVQRTETGSQQRRPVAVNKKRFRNANKNPQLVESLRSHVSGGNERPKRVVEQKSATNNKSRPPVTPPVRKEGPAKKTVRFATKVTVVPSKKSSYDADYEMLISLLQRWSI